jgi:hypothetical protein
LTSPDRIVRWFRRQLSVVLLPVFALALLAALRLAVGWQVAQERRAARHEAVAHAQALARVLSEHVSHILRQTDHATQLFKLKYEESGGRFAFLGEEDFAARAQLPLFGTDKAELKANVLRTFAGQELTFEALLLAAYPIPEFHMFVERDFRAALKELVHEGIVTKIPVDSKTLMGLGGRDRLRFPQNG